MQKTVTVDGRKYKIIPIPPALSPYSMLYAQKVKVAPSATIQEAEEQCKELEQIIDKILSATVTPKPEKADELQVLSAVFDLTGKVVANAGLFRQPKPEQPNTEESGSAGPVDP